MAADIEANQQLQSLPEIFFIFFKMVKEKSDLIFFIF